MIRRIIPSYYAVFIDYGRKGIEAVVDPEITRAGIIERLRTGEYQNVSFIHHVDALFVEDVTDELIEAAEQAARAMEAA